MSAVLFYLAVGRLVKKDGQFVPKKHVIVASLTEASRKSQEDRYKGHLRQIMDEGAAKLIPTKRLRLTGQDENAQCELHIYTETFQKTDSLVVYFAVTDSADFRKAGHSAQALLEDFKNSFVSTHTESAIADAKEKGGLHKSSQSLLNGLMNKYGANKLGKVLDQVNDVKGIMEQNMEKAIANTESMETLEGKAEGLEMHAQTFNKQAVQVRKRMQCEHYKLWAMIGGVVLIVLIIIIWSAVAKNSKKE